MMKFVQNLSEKDRRALGVLLLFAVGLLCYWGLTTSYTYQQSNMDRVAMKRSWLMSLYHNGHKVRRLEQVAAQQIKEGQDQSLLTLASSLAKEHQLSFKRFQPDGDRELNIWLEKMDFNAVLTWLALLERKNGIHVQQISVEKTEQLGAVDARITLVR